MRPFFQIFGVLALIAVAAIIGTIGMIVYNGQKLDRESKNFVDSAVPAIVRDWDKQEFLRHMSPDFSRATNADQIGRYFNLFATLGHLSNYEGSTGDSNMSFTTGAGGRVTAKYSAKAQFENGEAAIRVELVKLNDQWMINSWNVTPIGQVKRGPTHA